MSTKLGNKDVMAKNIQYYMDLYGKTRNDICSALKIKYTTFSDWVNAKTYPRIDSIELMANYFGIEKIDLVEEHKLLNRPKGVRIPVLGEVVAGVPIDAVEEYLDWEEITPELAETGDFFALKIKGDSMEPRIVAGDVVIVKMQSTAETGDIVIAMVNGDDACCKRFIKQNDGIILQSFNSAYTPMFFTKEEIETKPVSIIGKVIENRQKY